MNNVTLLRIKLEQNNLLAEVDRRLDQMLPAPSDLLPSRKIVKDRVWGLIDIPGIYVPLVDSKLLQRQRRVRQLGLSYLVYPSAGYSRFEHALGCFHAMGLLLDAVTRNAEGVQEAIKPTEEIRSQLLLGALLHDVGHMPFSHASEAVLERSPQPLTLCGRPLDDITDLVEETLKKSPIHLAELLSLLVVLSPRFRAFARRVVPQDCNHPDRFFDAVGAFIVGIPPSHSEHAWAQLLSGASDADKLDYMSRDAGVTGVPVSVDLARLLARCSVRRFTQMDLLPRAFERLDQVTLFLTDQSGTNALEEMTISRFVLYDRVYYHHKTRAAETVLAEMLSRAFGNGVFGSEVLDFWSMTDESVLHRAEANIHTREYAESILYRDLPKRALICTQRFVELPQLPLSTERLEAPREALGSVVGRLLDTIDETFDDPQGRADLLQAVRTLAGQYAVMLGMNLPPLRYITAIARPRNPFGMSGEALVVNLDGRVEEFRHYMPIEQWAAAFSLNKKFGYIFCDDPWRELVHIAAERVLWDRFLTERTLADLHPLPLSQSQTPSSRPESTRDSLPAPTANLGSAPQPEARVQVHVRLTSAAVTRAKLPLDEMRRLKAQLDTHNVFANARMLRPLVIGRAADRIARRFSGFEGAGGWQITPAWVETFVRQFPVVLQDEVCRRLNEMTVLDRATLTGACIPEIELAGRDSASTHGTVLGLSPNSGNLVRMLTEADGRSNLPSGWSFSNSGIASWTDEQDAIVFVDDIVGSGSQASVQLQAWMGVPRAEWLDPNEQNVFEHPLSGDLQDQLRRTFVRFVFARGIPEGGTTIETTARGLGMTKLSVRIAQPLVTVSANGLNDALHRHLLHVGKQVLAAARKEPDPEACAQDALGYGGRCAWVTGIFNVPTACPAALWCPGNVDGTPWVPFLIRRGYHRRIVYV